MPHAARPLLLLLAAFSLLAACESSPGARPATQFPEVVGASADDSSARQRPAPTTARVGAPQQSRARANGPKVKDTVVVGRVRSFDRANRIVVVDVQDNAPAGALADGTELIARDYNTLAQTGLLRLLHYVRGLPLNTQIVSGQPSPGDEVVWVVP